MNFIILIVIAAILIFIYIGTRDLEKPVVQGEVYETGKEDYTLKWLWINKPIKKMTSGGRICIGDSRTPKENNAYMNKLRYYINNALKYDYGSSFYMKKDGNKLYLYKK